MIASPLESAPLSAAVMKQPEPRRNAPSTLRPDLKPDVMKQPERRQNAETRLREELDKLAHKAIELETQTFGGDPNRISVALEFSDELYIDLTDDEGPLRTYIVAGDDLRCLNPMREGPLAFDLWIHIRVDDFFASRSELAFRNYLEDELTRRGLGQPIGSGSGGGEMDCSFHVQDEIAARKLIADTFAELAPGCNYRLTVNPLT